MRSLRLFASQLAKRSNGIQHQHALAGVVLREVLSFLRRDRSVTLAEFFDRFGRVVDLIQSSCSYAPLVVNSLAFVRRGLAQQVSVSKARSHLLLQCSLAESWLKDAQAVLASILIERIPRGGTVVVHGDDPLLLQAVHSCIEKKRCEVLLLEGGVSRTLSKYSLLKHSLDRVRVIPDLSARDAVVRADVVLLSALAVTPARIACPAGSGMLSDLSAMHGVPVYVVAPSWLFDPREEFLGSLFVGVSHRGKSVLRPDVLSEKEITGIISEGGIFSLKSFVEELAESLPWITQ